MTLIEQTVEDMADFAVSRRQEDTGIFNEEAAQAAKDETRRAAINALNSSTQNGHQRMLCLEIALSRASECFDRAFGRERIRMAGIDLEQHPRWRGYQAFYDAGLPPPTHAEAADHTIRTLGNQAGNQAGNPEGITG